MILTLKKEQYKQNFITLLSEKLMGAGYSTLHETGDAVTLIVNTTIKKARATSTVQIDLIHNGRHVGFAVIMQISYSHLRGQTTQVREVITNILATQMICFTFIECL